MIFNTKPAKLFLMVGIITLIMIAFYTLSEENIKGVFAPSLPVDQPQANVKDPFKEFLDKQQPGASLQPSQALPIQMIQIGDRNSAATVPVGTDPFKAFVEAQSKAKPDEAAISPFSSKK
jgi:hypothetical protein